MSKIGLIVVDPGHFHAALAQKEMYPNVAERVHVYAPVGPDLVDYLTRISRANEVGNRGACLSRFPRANVSRAPARASRRGSHETVRCHSIGERPCLCLTKTLCARSIGRWSRQGSYCRSTIPACPTAGTC